MERIEKEATINSLTHLESYYQSRYEHYLAMATEAKEHKERVGLLLLDLGRDVLILENNFVESGSINGQQNNNNESALSQSSDNGKTPQETRVPKYNLNANPENGSSSLLPSTESDPQEESSAQPEPEHEQIKGFLRSLSIAMSVIESLSRLDSGKTLHQNYLKKMLGTELEKELSVELVELYLDEAISRGLIERDEFDSKCYIASVSDDGMSNTGIEQNQDVAVEIASNDLENNQNQRKRRSFRPYNLPTSNKLKPTLLETIEQYINKCRPKRFSIEDVINYLYSPSEQLDWSQNKKNKVRSCISNILGRKTYLGKHWSRIKPGVYRPLT